MKKKVLIAINALNIGGAPYVVREHVKFLIEFGYDVHVLTLFRNKKVGIRGEIVSLIGETSLHEFRLRERSFFDLKTLFNIYHFIRRENFDLVFTHLFVPNTLVRFCAFCAGVRCIFSYEHSMYDDKKSWQKIVDKTLSCITARILVSNEATAQFTSLQEGIPLSKFSVVPTPVSIPSVSEERRSEMKNLLCLDNEKKCFVTVGRFSEEKGHYLILEALKGVPEKKRPLCVFVGYGPQEEFIKKKVREFGLSEDVLVITDPHNAKEYLAVADAFLLASRREGQALVVCEALAFGVPVIVPNIPSVMEYVEDGKNGFVFKKENVKDLRHAIERFMQVEDLSSFKKNALDTYNDHVDSFSLQSLERVLKNCN